MGKISFSYTVADNLLFLSNTALVTLDIVSASFQNPRNRLDVDDDGNISPLDVLAVVNELNRSGSRILEQKDVGPPFFDVDGNNRIDPLDVLQLVNYLNGQSGNAEGEATQSDALLTSLIIPAGKPTVDRVSMVPDYFDVLNIRKRARNTDAAFMEFGDDWK